MKFLSKVAEYIAKGLQVLNLFQPTVQLVNAKAGAEVKVVSQDLSEILSATKDSEAISLALGLKGTAKLPVLIPLVSDIMLQSAALSGHKIANQALYEQGIAKLSDGAVDIANSLDPGNIQVENKKA